MPRATFAGVEFDFLLDGLQDSHEGMTTVREIPGSGFGAPVAYVDLGGPLLWRRTVTIKVDNEAWYNQLAVLPGTVDASGLITSDEEGEQYAVLLSVARTWRKGGLGPQLLRTEWLFLPEAPAALAALRAEPRTPGSGGAVEVHPVGDTP